MRMASMDPDNVERTAATGCLASVIPNRVSYFFGMHGPSMHVDTACSSGLSAFDMACKVLYSGDAEAVSICSNPAEVDERGGLMALRDMAC